MPENEEQKLYMREKAKPKGGQPNPMPPQLFQDDDYLGVCCFIHRPIAFKKNFIYKKITIIPR